MSLPFSTHATPAATHLPPFVPTDRCLLQDGSQVLVRRLQPEDRELETAFLLGLSPRTRRQRFLCAFKQPSKALIDQLMDVDHDRHTALIAVTEIDGKPVEVGVSRYCATDDTGVCECAITVADDWQHHGLDELLMRRLIDEARAHGFRLMVSVDAASNQAIRELARRLGFTRQLDPADPSQAIHRLEL